MKPGRLALLALGCLVLFSAGAARYGVVDDDEARFALAVREMTERDDWIVPTNWGELRYQKPILAYWLGRLSQTAFGSSEFALRIPSMLCATLAVLLTAASAARFFGERTGWRAGWIMATSVLTVTLAHAFTADATQLLGVTLAFWAWLRLREVPSPAWPWQVAFWLGVAWALLVKLVGVLFLAAAGAVSVYAARTWSARARKGLVMALAAGAIAVSIPGLGAAGPLLIGGLLGFFGIAHLAGRSSAERVPLGIPVGAPVVALVLAAWAVPALLATDGAFFNLGIRGDLVGRSASVFEGHRGFPGYYVLATLGTFFPWSALLPAAIASERSGLRKDVHLLFLACWILGPFLLFELATTKLPHYMLVAFPALSVFVARETERRAAGATPGRAQRWFETAMGALPCALPVLAAVVVFGLAPESGLAVPAAVVGVVALAAGASWMRGFARGTGDPFPRLAIGALALNLVTWSVLVPALDQFRIATPVAAAVERHLRPEDRLVLLGVRQESIGYESPRVPEVLRSREFSRALEDPRTLAIVPERKLLRTIESFPARYERLEVVPEPALSNEKVGDVWIVRGAGPVP